MSLKTAKGTRDYVWRDRIILEYIERNVEKIYRKRGGIPMDTPMFELKSILLNKYGEDTKLIYDLADQGGEECALRYDLTVPLARYLAQTKTQKIKRYHTGKVFRRDQPSLSKGRYREFTQSDFDIVGEYLPMTADAEIISAACDILKEFKELIKKEYYIRINHKKLVDSIMEVSSVPVGIRKGISSAIDKLDKVSWAEAAKEMKEKGADRDMIEKIKSNIQIKGPLYSSIERIRKSEIGCTESGKEALADLDRLSELLAIYQVDEDIIIDLSLVRGLEYYTGILIEGGYEGIEGTLIAGGRYDNLVTSLAHIKEDNNSTDNAKINKKNSKEAEIVKCIGISFGISRFFSVLPLSSLYCKKSFTSVLVCSVGTSLENERLKMCLYLREHNINAEYFMGSANNFLRHCEYADSHDIPVIVLVGRREIENKEFVVLWGNRNDRKKKVVKKEDLISTIEDAILETGFSVEYLITPQ